MAQRRITRDGLDGLKNYLATLPEIESSMDVTYSVQQAIAELKAEIIRLMKKGYTLANVAELMTKQGFEIKAPTLKTYMSRVSGKRKVTREMKQDVQADKKPADLLADKKTAPALVDLDKKQDGLSGEGKFTVRPDSDDL